MSIEAFERQSDVKRRAVLAAATEEFAARAYADASTDAIARRCGISKGLLFHYFGSKKALYGYCLTRALDALTAAAGEPAGGFYDVLFSVMDQKLRLCARYPAETRLVNLASREGSAEVSGERAAIFARHAARTRAESAANMDRALAGLPLRGDPDRIREGLLLYAGAILNRYLLAYQNTPEAFFARAEEIKRELKESLDLMLYGVVKEEAE